MNFKKINNLTGWAVFLIAFLTYFLTREASASLWDTGEFIATANQLGLPHPPGAPLFVLLGRFFIILFGDNPATAASAVNTMSAAASAFTILFLFWSITHFARKMFVKPGEVLSGNQIFTVMTSGVVGALAYTFSDSFWYSAVEGEVYALSSFFTALVFWAILKWEHADEVNGHTEEGKARSEKWIVFLFFMMGLSIGVHLLNLLTIPAIVMIYYYRRFAVTVKGALIAFLVGCIITGLVQVAVIQYSMKAAGIFDVFFVNSVGLPFFAGFAIYFLALGALIFWAFKFNAKNFTKSKAFLFFALFLVLSFFPFVVGGNNPAMSILKLAIVIGLGWLAAKYLKPSALKTLKLALWCYVFMMIGYFMYFTTMIRSNANPGIDMNDVDNPMSLVYYLGREQYGSAPIVYGPHFLAELERESNGAAKYEEGDMRYAKANGKYVEIGRAREYTYKSEDKQLFPRIWSSSNDQFHFDTYVNWLGMDAVRAQSTEGVVSASGGMVQVQDQTGQTRNYNIPQGYSIRANQGQILSPGDLIALKKPSFKDNLDWFFGYQNSFMYWRYFMWNFAGRQNDVQNVMGNARDGNWITGINFIDQHRLGDQNKLPDSLKHNKANNKLFLLPFLLGIIGCVFQFIRHRNDWIVTFLLFFFTGLAIVLYLNQPGSQPRERDYAYVGSFYAFAIWIGLSVVALVRLAQQKAASLDFKNTLLWGSGLTFFIMILSSFPSDGKGILMTAALSAVMFAVLTAILTFVLRAVSSNGSNFKVLGLATAVITVLVPILMAQQEWDDHDRSQKTLAPDLARNYLESCAPNAILFTFGDNDTYPLWYLQEVEGVRPDIRLINTSLLGIDWYINQLRRKVNEADALKLSLTPEQILGSKLEVTYFQPRAGLPDRYFPMADVVKAIGNEVTKNPNADYYTFPVRKLSLGVDREKVLATGTASAKDSLANEINIEFGKNYLQRNELIILDIIASNNWERPIYFTNAYGELGFGQYLRREGMTYRLTPTVQSSAQNNWMFGSSVRASDMDLMYKNLMEKFTFGGADKNGTYFDEENRRHMLMIRSVFAETAGNLADAGKKEEASKLLDKMEAGINPANFPYAMAGRYNGHNQTGLTYLEAAYKAGKMDLANKIRTALENDMKQQQAYYMDLRIHSPYAFARISNPEYEINEQLLALLNRIVMRYDPQSIGGAPSVPNTEMAPPPPPVNPADTQ